MSYKCEGCEKIILSFVGVADDKIVIRRTGGKPYILCSWYCVMDWACAIDDGQITLKEDE